MPFLALADSEERQSNLPGCLYFHTSRNDHEQATTEQQGTEKAAGSDSEREEGG
jgi:hypothetical protein